MPKTINNLLLQYWDKALLALLAIIVLFIFFTRVRSSPIEAANQNGAKNLTKKLTQDADRLADRLKKSRLAEPPRESTDDPDLFGPDIELAEGYQGNLTQTPLTMFPPGGGTVKVAGNIPTPEVLAPLALQVQTSLGIPAPTTTSANTGAPESQQQIHWVTVAAKFPFRQQYERFAALDQNVVPENEVHLLFVRLELQREELQPDGSWSQAVSVNPYELYEGRLPSATGTLADPYSLPRRQEEMQNRDSFRSWLASAGFQEFIARPDFLPLTSFEEWIWPQQLPTGDDDLPAPVLSGKIPKDSAPKYREITAGGTRRSGRATVYRPTPNATTRQPGFEGVTIFGGGPNLMGGYQPSPTTTPTTTRRTSSRRSGERSQIPQTYKTLYDSDRGPEDVEIWAHDAAAEPGKVYRYRMRVLLSNPLCGKERAAWQQIIF